MEVTCGGNLRRAKDIAAEAARLRRGSDGRSALNLAAPTIGAREEQRGTRKHRGAEHGVCQLEGFGRLAVVAVRADHARCDPSVRQQGSRKIVTHSVGEG